MALPASVKDAGMPCLAPASEAALDFHAVAAWAAGGGAEDAEHDLGRALEHRTGAPRASHAREAEHRQPSTITASTSKPAPFGNAGTSMVERAGYGAAK